MEVLTLDEFIMIPGLPLTISHTGEGADFPIHSHGFTEVVIVRRGSGTHLLDGESLAIREGDVFVIQTRHTHGYEESRGMSLTNILFDQDTCLPVDADLRSLPGYHALFTLEPHYRPAHRLASCLQCSRETLNRVEHLIGELDAELNSPQPGSATIAMALFRQLVVLLCREYDGSRNDSSRSLMKLAEVVSWMEAHSHEALTIDDLRERAHMARSTFHRVFEEVYHRSPLEYLIGLRLEQAQLLLRTTHRSIAAIAHETGFSDGNYMSRQFRKRLNLTPRQYRSARTSSQASR
jgi:AraC-like DNA-binding protein